MAEREKEKVVYTDRAGGGGGAALGVAVTVILLLILGYFFFGRGLLDGGAKTIKTDVHVSKSG